MLSGNGGKPDESVLKMLDQLHGSDKFPNIMNEPLDVAQHDGNFCSLSHRRVTAPMMYEALHGDRVAPAMCKDLQQRYREVRELQQ